MGARGRRGFSMLELMMVLLLIGVAAAGIAVTLRTSERTIGTASTDMVLQAEGERALNVLLTDLRQTGRVDQGGGAVYPYLFTDGAASGAFAAYAHSPLVQHVPAGSPAYGSSTEIVYRVPEDQDGDGKPTASADGSLEWSDEEYAFIVVPDASGDNVLWKQVDGADTTALCRHVERFLVEDQTLDPSLGANHLRITLWLAMEDTERPGYLTKRFFMSVINMRNQTGELILGGGS